MSKEKLLIKNTAIVSIGKILTQLISFFLLPLYTAYLSTVEYGTVDLINTLTSLLIPFITLQLDQGIFRYLIDVRNDEEKKTKFISTTILFVLFQFTICTTIFLIISPWINNDYKYFLLATLLTNSLTNILLQITRGLGDNLRYTVGSFLFAVVGVICNVVFIAAFKLGAYGMLAAMIIGHVICAFYIIISKKLFRKIAFKYYDKKMLKQLIKYSFPLIPNAISWWIVNASDRVIITTMLSLEHNGIYTIANKFSAVITTMFSVFSITWTESAAVNYNEKDRDLFFNNTYDAVIRIFGSICICVISLMPIFFSILVNEQYADSYFQIPILIIATFFNILVSFIGSIYVAKKLTKEIAKTSVFAAIINITTHLLMIKFVGLYAASLSTLIAWIAMYLYRYNDSKKYAKLKNNYKLLFSMILITALNIYTYYLNIRIINIVVAVFTVMYSIYINKRTIKYLTNLIFKKFLKKEKGENL